MLVLALLLRMVSAMLVLALLFVSASRRATLGAAQSGSRLRSYVERHCVSFDPSRAHCSLRASKGKGSLPTITEEGCQPSITAASLPSTSYAACAPHGYGLLNGPLGGVERMIYV